MRQVMGTGSFCALVEEALLFGAVGGGPPSSLNIKSDYVAVAQVG